MCKWLLANRKSLHAYIVCRHHICTVRMLSLAISLCAGSVLAAVAGIALAIVLWCCIWRHGKCLARKKYTSLDVGGRSGALECRNWQPSYDMDDPEQNENKVETDCEAQRAGGKLLVKSCNENTTVPTSESLGTVSLSQHLPQTTLTDTQLERTFSLTAQPVMTDVSNVRSMSLPPLQPLLIPAPLWQDVEIPSDKIRIVQNDAGNDWILGQGSYGKVYVRSCSLVCRSSCVSVSAMYTHSVYICAVHSLVTLCLYDCRIVSIMHSVAANFVMHMPSVAQTTATMACWCFCCCCCCCCCHEDHVNIRLSACPAVQFMAWKDGHNVYNVCFES